MRVLRRGYSLVECLVVISLVAVTMSSVTVTLHNLQRAERRLRTEWEHDRQLERFVERWRDDVHSAESASAPASEPDQRLPASLRLNMSRERTIEYLLADTGIERIVRASGDVQHRESYSVILNPAARWEIATGGEQTLVSLELGPAAAKGPNRLLAVLHLGVGPAGSAGEE